MLKVILDFFDKLEDKVRKWLSMFPLLYAFIGGTGVIIFWRGIWHSMDYAMEYFTTVNKSGDIGALIWWDGPLSVFIGLVILITTGIFTSSFIGNEIIISGIKGEKKMVDKTEAEVRNETESMKGIEKQIKMISNRIGKIEKAVANKNK